METNNDSNVLRTTKAQKEPRNFSGGELCKLTGRPPKQIKFEFDDTFKFTHNKAAQGNKKLLSINKVITNCSNAN